VYHKKRREKKRELIEYEYQGIYLVAETKICAYKYWYLALH